MTDTINALVERERGLKRSLSTGQLSMIAIGGAIGTGLFLGSAFAIGFAGPSVLVSYAIGGVITLLLMGCLAEMTVGHPTSGAFGTYAEFYIGPLAGFLVRYAYWSCIVLAVGTEVSAIALYMQYWFPAVPGWIWIVGFSSALIAINAMSVHTFGSVEYGFSMFKIAAIVVFLLLGAYFVISAPAGSGVGLRNYTAHGGFFPNGLSGTWVAVIVAIFSYLSIEMIAVAAGEAKDPQKAITRAFRATMFRLVFFYLLTLALVIAIVPWQTAGTAGSPFVTVMSATHVPGAAGVINLVILVAALSAMNSQLYITTRMMFSLARAGYAPQRLGEVNARGVPLAALLLSSVGIAVAVVVNMLVPEASFTLMISISMFGALFTWLMIFVTHLFFRRQHAEPLAFRMWGYPYTSILGAAALLAILITSLFTREFRMTLVYGVPFLIVLTIAYYVWFRGSRRVRRPA
ncbi:MAG TPA: amino acid permease [Steroidobacteraceae bacterium]|nr:amino acid permease [Steroidobacteraceae bacterium]